MKRILPLAFILTVLISSAFASTNLQAEVTIYPQPDSPLQLSNAVPAWRTSTGREGEILTMLSIEFASQNVSDKPIRAYTIRKFEGEFDTDRGMTLFNYTALGRNGFFKPNQIQTDGIGESGYSKIPKRIKLAVDFVEFSDGSTWGKDLSETAQTLIGMRAAIKAALERFKIIEKQNGIASVIKSLDETNDESVSENQSTNWNKGYRLGSRIIKNRIKLAFEKEGNKAAETELQKLIDNSLNY